MKTMYGKKANLKNCPFCGCEMRRNLGSDGVFYEHPDNSCVFWADRLKGSADYQRWNNRHGVTVAEFIWMKQFIEQNTFDEEICRDSLRCLWTAYCFHHNLDADTSCYDADLRELWEVMADREPDTADWHDLNSFENFMSRWLM